MLTFGRRRPWALLTLRLLLAAAVVVLSSTGSRAGWNALQPGSGQPGSGQLRSDRPATEERPNLVFIFSDDHACQALSAYGSRLIATPNLDRLAAAGMRFDRCLVTNSICGPSRAVILTGKYSHRNGFRDNASRFDGQQMTFVRALRQAGYATAIFGKWHLVSDPVDFDAWSVLPGQGRYYNPVFLEAGGVKSTVPGYVTDVVTDKAIEWLRQRSDVAQPFLLMVQHKAPHREWMPGPDHLADFTAEIPEPATLWDDYQGRPDVIKRQAMTIARHMRMGEDLKYFSATAAGEAARAKFLEVLDDRQRAAWNAAYDPRNREFDRAGLSGPALTRWMYQRYMQDYLRCIASIDDNVGRLLDELDQQGLSSRTVVVYSSDQGFYLGEHGWYDKRWIFEPSLRTPLLVRWPGVTQPGSTCQRIVSNLDFAPTFLDLAQQPAYDGMQGRSLVPLLRGETPADWRKSFYYHYYETTVHDVPAHYGVVTDRHKLVCYYQTSQADGEKEINEWELLDLQVNPEETKSFLREPAYAEVRDQLFQELTRLRREVGEPTGERQLPR